MFLFAIWVAFVVLLLIVVIGSIIFRSAVEWLDLEDEVRAWVREKFIKPKS